MNKKGITLIELLVTLVIGSIVVAGIYRTFISQQHVYTVQEQVVEMQQNSRLAISQMMREIRMAGLGVKNFPITIGGQNYNNVINPDFPVAGSITIVSGIGGTAILNGINPPNQITLDRLTDAQGNTLFDLADRSFISIDGLESFTITNIVEIDATHKLLTLNNNINNSYKTDGSTVVYAIRAISYGVTASILNRNDNLGGGPQPLADNVESIGIQYLDANGNLTANPPDIRTIRMTMTARTDRQDPELKGGDGFRRREITTNIQLRNMGT
jgi:prepilin-type N-terminal cleavage/methylation domain-containing protein